MKKFLLAGLIFIANLGFATVAAEPFPKHDEAERVCQRLFSSTDQQDCWRVINQAGHFNREAVNLCGSMFTPTDQIQCLLIVRDKNYSDEAVFNCRRRFSTEEKISCLNTHGYKSKTSEERDLTKENINKDFVSRGLKRAIDLMDQGMEEKAKAVLEGLLQSM